MPLLLQAVEQTVHSRVRLGDAAELVQPEPTSGRQAARQRGRRPVVLLWRVLCGLIRLAEEHRSGVRVHCRAEELGSREQGGRAGQAVQR